MKTVWALLMLSCVVASPVIAQQAATADDVWGSKEEEPPVKSDENLPQEVIEDGTVSADPASSPASLEDDVD